METRISANLPRLLPVIGVIAFVAMFASAFAQEAETDNSEQAEPRKEMTIGRLQQLIQRIDPETQVEANSMVFQVEGVSVTLVFDLNADRMRMVVPVAAASALTPELMTRILQANFDSALDARYAVAQDVLWSTFIHPLSPLTDDEFLSGLGQTINLVFTFGSTFNSGMFTFGGGDSEGILRQQLIEELRKLGKPV